MNFEKKLNMVSYCFLTEKNALNQSESSYDVDFPPLFMLEKWWKNT